MDSQPLDPPPPTRSGSKRGRCCLIGCGLLLALLVGGCCVSSAVIQHLLGDPDLAEARMQALVPSSPPAGFAGNFSLDVQGLLVAVLAPDGAPMAQSPFSIVAVAVPPHGDSARAVAQLREGVVQQFQIQADERADVEVSVRDEVYVGEQLRGATAAGTAVRIVFVAVPRRGPEDPDDLGDVVLIAGGADAAFDDDAWAAFLASIR